MRQSFVCPACGYKVTADREVKFCELCGGKMSADQEVNTGPLKFEYRKSAINFDKVYADLQVTFHTMDYILVTIEGEPEMLSEIVVDATNPTIEVHGKLPGVEKLTKYSGIEIEDGVVTVDGIVLDPKKKLRINLTLPMIAEVQLGKFAIGLFVGQQDGGTLTILNSGFMNVIVWSLEDLTYDLSGMADAIVLDVKGKFKCSMSGNGGFSGRNIGGPANIEISGNANLGFVSMKGNVDLEISGSCSFETQSLNAKLCQVDLSGNGNVQILNGSVDQLSAEISGAGSMGFAMEVNRGTYEISGAGSIHTKKCKSVLSSEVTGAGSITFG